MSKKRFFVELVIGVFLFIGLAVNGIYALSQYRMQHTNEVSIYIESNRHAHLLHADDIRDVMESVDGCCEGSKREEINISVLEENIDDHPLVSKSEVFSTLNGGLYIQASVKRPVARVNDGQSSFYLDEYGEPMPLSKRYSLPVLLVTGSIDAWQRTTLMNLIHHLNNDHFFASRIAGVDISEQGDVRLYPSSMGFTILLGAETNAMARLSKLVVFWENALNEELAERLKQIDLRFNRQVVCQF